jgi:hypothetical protein
MRKKISTSLGHSDNSNSIHINAYHVKSGICTAQFTEWGGAGGLIGFSPGKELSGQEAHVGKVLGGITTTIHHILGGSTNRFRMW